LKFPKHKHQGLVPKSELTENQKTCRCIFDIDRLRNLIIKILTLRSEGDIPFRIKSAIDNVQICFKMRT
jgi:hypothetical protein